MELPVFLNDILFVIVLYGQKPKQSPAFHFVRSLGEGLPAPVSVFIYDNSAQSSPVNAQGIVYRHDTNNSGVSKAYNEAAVCATRLKKRWLLFLDQDTHAERASLLKIFETTLRHPGAVAFVPKLKDLQGLVSPFRWAFGRGQRTVTQQPLLALREFRFMNSGLLIKLSAFEAAGGYDETIPLDFSDIAFGERLKRVADQFVVMDIIWSHRFSGVEAAHASEAIHRFDLFCLGSFRMGKVFGHAGVLGLRALIRSVRLSFRYRRPDFIKTFVKHALHG